MNEQNRRLFWDMLCHATILVSINLLASTNLLRSVLIIDKTIYMSQRDFLPSKSPLYLFLGDIIEGGSTTCVASADTKSLRARYRYRVNYHFAR